MQTASLASSTALLPNTTSTLITKQTSSMLMTPGKAVTSFLHLNLQNQLAKHFDFALRPSCPALVASLKDGLDAAGAESIDFGLKTTPQLHYLVRCINTQGTNDAYGEPTEEGYYVKLSEAFKTLMKGKPAMPTINVDCANGVGAPKLKDFLKYVDSNIWTANIVNDDIKTKGKLNYNVCILLIPLHDCMRTLTDKSNELRLVQITSKLNRRLP